MHALNTADDDNQRHAQCHTHVPPAWMHSIARTTLHAHLHACQQQVRIQLHAGTRFRACTCCNAAGAARQRALLLAGSWRRRAEHACDLQTLLQRTSNGSHCSPEHPRHAPCPHLAAQRPRASAARLAAAATRAGCRPPATPVPAGAPDVTRLCRKAVCTTAVDRLRRQVAPPAPRPRRPASRRRGLAAACRRAAAAAGAAAPADPAPPRTCLASAWRPASLWQPPPPACAAPPRRGPLQRCITPHWPSPAAPSRKSGPQLRELKTCGCPLTLASSAALLPGRRSLADRPQTSPALVNRLSGHGQRRSRPCPLALPNRVGLGSSSSGEQ